MAGALLSIPMATTISQMYACAATFAAAGGMVTVLFFALWGRAYGLRHLGRIQGAAQALTVIASAFGPDRLASGQRATGSYMPTLKAMAAVSLVLGVAAWFVPWPKGASG